MKRSWIDQPSDVEGIPILCNNIRLGDEVQIEVRANGDDEPYWVTAGNLFGSQTIRCKDAHTAFQVINSLNPKKTVSLPDGAELVEG